MRAERISAMGPLKKTVLVLPLLLLLPAAADANLRAPWQVSRFPSFSMLPVQGLEVLSEDLAFECGSLYKGDPDEGKLLASSCKVTALYKVRAAAGVSAQFEFISQSDKSFSAAVNGKPEQVQTSQFKAGELAEAYEARCRHCSGAESALTRARFLGALKPGENTILVAYMQPLTSNEISYGYFQESRWSQGFGYELWPLKEWKRAKDFRLRLRISMPKPGLFSRMWSAVAWTCSGIDYEKRPGMPFPSSAPVVSGKEPQNIALAFNADEWEWTAQIGYEFADRLSCSMQEK